MTTTRQNRDAPVRDIRDIRRLLRDIGKKLTAHTVTTPDDPVLEFCREGLANGPGSGQLRPTCGVSHPLLDGGPCIVVGYHDDGVHKNAAGFWWGPV